MLFAAGCTMIAFPVTGQKFAFSGCSWEQYGQIIGRLILMYN
jgi:hypothetical protein